MSFVVSVWVIALIAFVVLSAAIRNTSVRARRKLGARQVKNEISNEKI